MALPIVPIAMALAQIAPPLMKWLGAGDTSVAVAEKAIGIAQAVTGTATPEAALAALQADQVKQHEYRMAVEANALELQRLHLADVANAREREIRIATAENAPLINKVIAPVLALIVVIGGGCIMVWSPDADVRMAANSIIMLVVGYYFGTSLGSTKANQLMRDLARKEP